MESALTISAIEFLQRAISATAFDFVAILAIAALARSMTLWCVASDTRRVAPRASPRP